MSSSSTASQIGTPAITSTSQAATTFSTVTTTQTSSVNGGQTYTVVQGDTAYNIAARFGISLADLEVANAGIVPDWNLLQVGITLQIPSASSATITTTPTGSMGTAPSIPTPSSPQIPDSSASALSSVTGSLAVRNLDLDEGTQSPRDVYNFYSGDGSVEQGWPPTSSWLSFNALWEEVEPYIGQKCVDNVPANSPNETDNVRDSIIAVANKTYMDPRFILAVVMQESNGCVRVVSTAGGNSNPGLMQSFEGKGSCDNNGMPVYPCPPTVIHQMIVDGTAAPVEGPTLVSALNKAASMDNCEPAQAFYRAARLYNSGLNSMPASGDLGGAPGATLCYSSDIANRLLGWVNGAKECHLDGYQERG